MVGNSFDYVSILAGGVCPIGCKFCVGNSIRKKVSPHFALLDKIELFFEMYKKSADLLSISGSTSDPLFVKNLKEIVKVAKKNFKKISLHTCAIEKLLNFDIDPFVEVCISLHELPNEKLKRFIEKNDSKVRVSIVYDEENYSIVDSLKFFEEVPAKLFTVRKNIFNPKVPKFISKLKKIGEVFNQPVYIYKNKKIVIWDFADANNYINARYIWPDGQIRKQCFWANLHEKDCRK